MKVEKVNWVASSVLNEMPPNVMLVVVDDRKTGEKSNWDPIDCFSFVDNC